MDNFRRLATMTPRELARLSPDAPTVATGIGLGPDAAEYETVASNPAETARAIVKAAKTRDAGGPVAAKPSDAAAAILAAGARRRNEAEG